MFAESQPSENGFVTAYPLVFHKWQANADPATIYFPMPVLAESCLHAGQNIIRTTDIQNDWMTDTFTKDFQISITSSNGFRKAFPLKKNIGLSGWELNITKEDLNEFPKMDMVLDAAITSKRGFNQIESPKFEIQLTNSGTWEMEPNSQRSFAVGGKRRVTLRNQSGNCRCVEAAIYKPTIGGEFVFGSKKLEYSTDNKEVSFETDTTTFPSGAGQFEVRQNGGDSAIVSAMLFPPLPAVANLKIGRGDSQAVLVGERLEQVFAIRVNGKRAIRMDGGSDFMNTQNNPATNSKPSIPISTGAARERTFAFEDSSVRQDSIGISLELELDNQRIINSLIRLLQSRNKISELPSVS